MSSMPTAVRKGPQESCGRWMVFGSTGVRVSPFFSQSYRGRSVGKVVGKSCAKLYGAGGEAAVHSSVKPPQGFAEAVAGARTLCHMFHTHTMPPASRVRAPRVDTKFSSLPAKLPSGYV